MQQSMNMYTMLFKLDEVKEMKWMQYATKKTAC